jgi:hypothetical protein
MFKLDDKQKKGKSAVLQEIMDLMDAKSGSKLRDLKKPAVMEMDVTKLDPEDKADGGDDEASEDDPMSPFSKPDENEPSDEEKAKIAELYNKYCAK